MHSHAERGNDRQVCFAFFNILPAYGARSLFKRYITGPTARQLMIVPTLCVGMPHWTLRVRLCDAERHGMRSHAERGNDRHHASLLFRLCMTAALFSR
jgi:hypothetical protein